MCKLDVLDEEHINGSGLALQLHLIPSLPLRHALHVYFKELQGSSYLIRIWHFQCGPYGAFTANKVSSFKQGMLLISK